MPDPKMGRHEKVNVRHSSYKWSEYTYLFIRVLENKPYLG
jgi:hypothetical protein